jgi:hypothetical protein
MVSAPARLRRSRCNRVYRVTLNAAPKVTCPTPAPTRADSSHHRNIARVIHVDSITYRRHTSRSTHGHTLCDNYRVRIMYCGTEKSGTSMPHAARSFLGINPWPPTRRALGPGSVASLAAAARDARPVAAKRSGCKRYCQQARPPLLTVCRLWSNVRTESRVVSESCKGCARDDTSVPLNNGT